MFDSLTTSLNVLAASHLGEPLFAIPVYIFAGLASSLFPCVYPLIPVTVGFLQNRTVQGQSKYWHPLLYWAGTIMAYTILGFMAALGGGAFNLWIQNGFVIVLFGFLFLFLSFVTMDWYPLSLNTGDKLIQKASQKSGGIFTIAMGLAAGFVASACVAPALVTMLLFIAKHTAMAAGPDYFIKTGYGGLLSTSFGIGIGIPFFLAGVLGTRLPKSGTWMSYIKYSFAILIGLYAFQELFKGFAVLGLNDMDIYLIFAGIILIFIAILLGLRPPEQGDLKSKTRFFFALIFLALAAALIIRGINPGLAARADMHSEIQIKKAKIEMIGNLKFYRDEALALELARKENKPVFIDFYADWCANCKDFSKYILDNKKLNSALQQAVLIKIYDTDPVFEKYETDKNSQELLIGLPFFLVLKSDASFHWKSTNYRDSQGMINAINSAANQ